MRQLEAAKQMEKEAKGDFSHLKDGAAPLPQPTLPKLSVYDDDMDDTSSFQTRGPPGSTFTQDYYARERKGSYTTYNDYSDYPPMPAYNAQGVAGGYAQYGPSQASLAQNEAYMYEEDNESQAHLAAAAAPMAYEDSRASLPNPYAGHDGGGGSVYSNNQYAAQDYGNGSPLPGGPHEHAGHARQRSAHNEDAYGGYGHQQNGHQGGYGNAM